MDSDVDSFVLIRGDHQPAVVREHLAQARMFDLSAGNDPVRLYVQASHLRLSAGMMRGNTLVVIGPAPVPERVLTDVLATAPSLLHLDAHLGQLAGQYWLVASINGRIRVQGSASGLHRVFYADVAGATMVSSRARLLASIGEFPVDRISLAMRLLEPLQHPLAELCCWETITAVPPHSFLQLAGPDPARLHRWWTPPFPDQDLAAGAELVTSATLETVGDHLSGRSRATCEISGGLDSSTLTATLQIHKHHEELPFELHGITAVSRDEFNSDAQWARELTTRLPLDSHTFLQPDQLPWEYDELDDASRYPLDEPSIAIGSHSRLNAVTDLARAVGTEVHFTGYGGDQLFLAHPALSRDLLVTHPLTALRRLRAYRSMYRWRGSDLARQLIAPGSYRSWLHRTYLSSAPRDPHAAMLSWGGQAVVPHWLSAEVTDAIAARIRVMSELHPLAPSPGRHQELGAIYEISRVVRGVADIAHFRGGIGVVAPFLDERVINAALSVRIDHRLDPYRYKPLLLEAFKEFLPDSLQRRTTKGAHNADKAQALLRNASAIRTYFADSKLVEAGLIDPHRLYPLLRQPDTPLFDNNDLAMTVACEAWLRSVDNRSSSPTRPGHSSSERRHKTG